MDLIALILQYCSPSHFFHCRRCAAPCWCDPQTQHLLQGEAASAHWLEAGGQWQTVQSEVIQAKYQFWSSGKYIFI